MKPMQAVDIREPNSAACRSPVMVSNHISLSASNSEWLGSLYRIPADSFADPQVNIAEESMPM